MAMISIPVWVFVIIVILASITALFMLLFIVGIFACLFTPAYKNEENYCPDKLDPDYNPEYIPSEELANG